MEIFLPFADSLKFWKLPKHHILLLNHLIKFPAQTQGSTNITSHIFTNIEIHQSLEAYQHLRGSSTYDEHQNPAFTSSFAPTILRSHFIVTPTLHRSLNFPNCTHPFRPLVSSVKLLRLSIFSLYQTKETFLLRGVCTSQL